MIVDDFLPMQESSGYSLSGSFTHDLTTSKVWLLEQLARIIDDPDVIYVLGSWYGNLSLYIYLTGLLRPGKIINVERDKGMLAQSKKMLDHVGAPDVEHMLKDTNDLDYRQLTDHSMVINTSLTDMPGREWFDRIPKGTVVALQARDHDPGHQFHSTQDILKKFPLDQVLYQGQLPLKDPETKYTRYMVIGIR